MVTEIVAWRRVGKIARHRDDDCAEPRSFAHAPQPRGLSGWATRRYAARHPTPPRGRVAHPTRPRSRRRRLSLRRGAVVAAAGVALEEQRLADDGGDGGGLERLGDQEGRLRTLAGEEPFRIGGD